MTDDLYQLAHAAAQAADAAQREYEASCANYDGIPFAQLSHAVWGFHTAEKIPVSYAGVLNGWPLENPLLPDKLSYMKVNNPDTWTTPANLLAVRPNASRRLIGPTLSITTDLNLIVIDLDSPRRSLETFIKKKQNDPRARLIERTPEYVNNMIEEMAKEQKAIINWATSVGAWIEFSMSGAGVHILVFGTLPHHKYDLFHGSIFTAKQLLHMTGKLHPSGGPVIPLVQGAAIDELMRYLYQQNSIRVVSETPTTGATDSVLGLTSAFGRQLDLTDEQVIERLPSINRSSANALMGGAGKRGNWSDDTYLLISDLDKITGDADQVHRILFRSSRMQSPGRGGDGRDRHERTERLFDHMLAKCRGENDVELQRRIERLAEARRLQAGMASTVQFPSRPQSRAERRAEARRASEQAVAELARRNDKAAL